MPPTILQLLVLSHLLCINFLAMAQEEPLVLDTEQEELNQLNELEDALDNEDYIEPTDQEIEDLEKPLPPPKPKEVKTYRFKRTKDMNTFDQVHLSFSEGVFRATNYVDQFFANDKEIDKDNGTRLRVFNTNTLQEHQDYQNKTSFRAQLRLPYLAKKFHLAIEQSDVNATNQTALTDNYSSLEKTSNNKDVQAGIGYVEQIEDYLNFKITGGLRFKNQPYPFIKNRIFKDFSLGPFELNTSLSVYWDDRDGYAENAYADISKKLSNGVLFRWINEQRWEDLDDTLRFNHGPIFFYQISDKRVISYYARVNAVNRPNYQVTNYRVGISYRQRLYKKWLYYELSPFIDYTRINDFAPSEGVILKLEAIIGEL